jgi:outer membrane protein OmpA-like peptidoglycan-associated protein
MRQHSLRCFTAAPVEAPACRPEAGPVPLGQRQWVPGEPQQCRKGNEMTSRSLKATTATVAVLSLLQPLPALTQTSSGAGAGVNASATGPLNRLGNADTRSFEEICAEAMIVDPDACELHIQALRSEFEAEVTGDAAFDATVEAESDPKDEAEALAAELEQAATQAQEQAEEAAEAAAQEADAATRATTEAQVQVDADAEALDQTETTNQVEIDAAATAQAELDAQAEADAQTAADAQVEADTRAAADAQADADAQVEADLEAQTATEGAGDGDGDSGTTATVETPEQSETVADDCAAEVVGPEGTLICVDALTSEGIEALAGGTDAETEVQTEVTTETVTEESRRSSSEEFREWGRDRDSERAATDADQTGEQVGEQSASGLSDLERAGLFVLGAVVVGAILQSGQRVEANTGDRVIVVDEAGTYRVLKDDDALLRQPGSEVRTERFNDGSVRTTITRDDGTRIITVRDSAGRALRRVRIEPDGREYLLIDDTRTFEPVIVRDLPRPVYDEFDYRAATDRESLRLALLAADRRDIGRSFSLRQVRDYVEVRELAPEINLAGITFATNSSAIQPSQAEQLREMGLLMRDFIREDPTELFLVEGHTDATGPAGYNLLLSDRRAESVALALTEYFDVPPENMVVQGYGQSQLKIPTQQAERLNRRVGVRRITPLVR